MGIVNAAQVQLNAALSAPVQASSRARPDAKTATLDFRSIRDGAVKNLDNGKRDAAEEKPATAAEKDTELAAEAGALLQTAVQPVQTAPAGAADTTDDSATQIQPEISTCCSMPDTLGKIADILEGFGLLKQDGSTQTVSQEGLQLLARLTQGAGAPDTDANTASMGTAAGNEAGMLKATSNDEMQTLQGLINEYFCSLENGKPGAAEDAAQPAAGQLSLPGEASAASAPPLLPIATQDKPAAQDAQAAQDAPQTPARDMLGRLVSALHKALGETDEGGSAAKDDAPLAQPDAAPIDAQPAAFAFKARASVQTPGTDAPPQATGKDMAENIKSIVERMNYSAAHDEQEFSVSLKPAHLGELSIRLVKSGDGMLAQIKAADETTRGLIQNELNTLVDQLKEKGVPLSKIEVTYEAPSFSFNPQQHSSQRQNSETSTGNRAKGLRMMGAVQAYEAATPAAADTLLYAGESSIEFQA